MKRSLGFTNSADFKHKTWDIIMHHVCLRAVNDRTRMRFNKSTRKNLFFEKGKEYLDKEMDVAYIVRQIRLLRYFLKSVLDKDQYCLLKLKGTSLIPSSDDETKAIPGKTSKKFKKDMVLDRLIMQLQRKTLTKQDIKMLEVLGFGETLKILIQEKNTARRRDEELNAIAGLDIAHKFIDVGADQDELVAPMLGTTQEVYSAVKRNSKAFRHT